MSSLVAPKPWQESGLDIADLNPVASMISRDEFRYLHWLARERYRGHGAIVDGGPLLGGSTVAMAEGLRLNPHVEEASKDGRIHSYDLFLCTPAVRSVFRDEPAPPDGADLLPRFLDATAPWRSLIQVHGGDIRHETWRGGPIEILFIDLAKTWDIQAHLLREFFPRLIPGVSILVQQDYFYHGCPWIHLVMERLSDYFTPAHLPQGPTLGFTLDRPIPSELLHLDYERLISRDEAIALADRAAARHTGAKRLSTLTGKAFLFTMFGDIERSLSTLETIRSSPDYDSSVNYDFEQLCELVVPHLHAPGDGVRRRVPTADDVAFVDTLLADAMPQTVLEIIEASETAQPLLSVVMDRSSSTRPVHVLRSGRAQEARETLRGERIDLAVIDGERLHPWPIADLLCLLPVMAPGAWIVLRDLREPMLNVVPKPGQGPRHLFDTWPGESRRYRNIGAIRLPRDPACVPAMVAEAVQAAWEAWIPNEMRSLTGLQPGPLTASPIRSVALMQQATGSGRPLYLCGSGMGARSLLALLTAHQVPVSGFIDRDPRRQGGLVDGLPVCAAIRPQTGLQPRPYFGVSGLYAEEIVADLESAGWTRDDDFASL